MSEYDGEVQLSRRKDDIRITGKAVQAARSDAPRQSQSSDDSTGSDTSGYWNDGTGSYTDFFTFGVSRFGGSDVLA